MIEIEVLEKIYNQLFEEQPVILQTGFRGLDFLLSITENSSLITIGARPGMGKTSFILCIMHNLLIQNRKCLLFSLSMPTQRIIKRLIIQKTEIDSVVLTRNEALQKRKNYKDAITEALYAIGIFDLNIIDEQVNIEEIREQIESLKPEYVFIDYLQLISVPNIKKRSEALETVVKELKNIARSNECIIFITSQLSRVSEKRMDKRPLLSDLRERGAIENISDIVMFIHRSNKGKAEIIVAKNPEGGVGIVDLRFRASIMKFLEPVTCDEC